MEFRRIDYLHGHTKSPSTSPVEKHSANTVLAPQTPFQHVTQKQIPNAPDAWDSYISTTSNSGLSSASCLLPPDEPSSQTQACLNSGILKNQSSIPKSSQQSTNPTTIQSNFAPTSQTDKYSTSEPQCPDLNASIWEYLKKQDEKYCCLLEEFHTLKQKAVPCEPNIKTAQFPKNDSNIPNGIYASSQTSLDVVEIGALGGNTEYSKLLARLQAQRERILELEILNRTLEEKNRELKEEKQQLQNRNNELVDRLLLRANESSLIKFSNANSPQSLNPDLNVAGSVVFEERNKHCANNADFQQETVAKKTSTSSSNKTSSGDVGNIEIRQNNEIEKTSTSTMTSVIYDGSDKVVYKKLTTVTTDFKKQCNEVSAQCSVNTEAVVTPRNQPSTGTDSGSRKKRPKCRKCGKCSPHYGGKSKAVHNASSGAIENECEKTVKAITPNGNGTICSIAENAVEKFDVHNTVPKRTISPRYEKILRNVNELGLNFDKDEAMPNARALLKSNSKALKKNTPSPRIQDTTPLTRKSENRRYSDRRQSSCSSSESESSPEKSKLEVPSNEQEIYDNKTGSTTISMYGLSSPNLSKDTRKYLDNFGLVRDSSRTSKSRTTLAKRYLR